MTFTRANVSGVGTSGLVLQEQVLSCRLVRPSTSLRNTAQRGISLEDAGRMMVGFIYVSQHFVLYEDTSSRAPWVACGCDLSRLGWVIPGCCAAYGSPGCPLIMLLIMLRI
jgi:hypothetical protein